MITDFDDLNFTLGNEDVSLEWRMAAEHVGHMVVVAGSGTRVLALVARGPARVSCCDTSPKQLALSELRVESLRAWDRPRFLAFWGYLGAEMAPDVRRELLASLPLSESSRQLLLPHWKSIGFGPPLYSGRWERLQHVSTRPHRWILGSQWKEIFRCASVGEQQEFFSSKFPRIRFAVAIALAAFSMRLFFTMFASRLPRLDPGFGFYRYFRRGFEAAINQFSVRRAFFLQLMFCGRLEFEEACPVEVWPEVFAKAQSALRSGRTQVTYHCGNVMETCGKLGLPIDFLSLSNVPTYFSGSRERGFLQELAPSLSPGAVVVYRADLHTPVGVDDRGFSCETQRWAAEIACEGTQLYSVSVYRKG